MRNVIVRKIGAVVAAALVVGMPIVAAAQTAPVWNATTTETVVSALTTSFGTQFAYVLNTISGYVLPVLVVLGIFGLIFGILWRVFR